MTDLEITRLCAEAMGFIPYRLRANGVIQQCGNGIYVEDAHLERGYYEYTPLRDDAQALALMNTFHLHVWWWLGDWTASMSAKRDVGIAVSPSCNRAICECVAKMQQAKT